MYIDLAPPHFPFWSDLAEADAPESLIEPYKG